MTNCTVCLVSNHSQEQRNMSFCSWVINYVFYLIFLSLYKMVLLIYLKVHSRCKYVFSKLAHFCSFKWKLLKKVFLWLYYTFVNIFWIKISLNGHLSTKIHITYIRLYISNKRELFQKTLLWLVFGIVDRYN